jgi:diguanylate cyclase (GGDEF)-like protein
VVIQSADMAPFDAGTPETNERGFRRMAALAEVDLHGSSLEEVLARLTRVTTELLPVDLGASVVLWDSHSERFTMASSTVPGGALPLEQLRSTGGVSRWVVDQGEAVAVADIAENPVEPNPVTAERGIRAYVATPILAGDRALGVLFAMSGVPRNWDAADLAFLRTLSLRAASAIEAARLADEANWARERAEALSQVANALMGVSSLTEVLQTIAESVAAAISADYVRLSVEGLGPRREGALVTGGIDADAAFCDSCQDVVSLAKERAEAAHYAVSIAPDEIEAIGNTGAGAVIVAPLRYRGRHVGFLTAIRRSGNPLFAPDDAALLTGMATQAVVAIDNASLMSDTQEALAELSALFEIVQVQNSGSDLSVMLEAMAGVVSSALPAWKVSLACLEPGSHHIEHIVTGGRGDSTIERSLVDAELDHIFEDQHREPSLEQNDEGEERLVVPLWNRNEPIGILVAENPADTVEFVENARELAAVMGSQITVAITNALLFEETQRLATTDALTGLSNRRSLFQLADRAFAAATRYDRPLTALMFDIDHFKRVNDAFGHGVGDEVLREIARRCESGVREVDILGRYGGEEFVAILPETGLEGAMGVAERLRQSVDRTPIYTSAGPIPVTISAGVAKLDGECGSLKELLEGADTALYDAKHSGRNRVRSR